MEFLVESCWQSNNSMKKKKSFQLQRKLSKAGVRSALSTELQSFQGSVLVRASRDLNTDDY